MSSLIITPNNTTRAFLAPSTNTDVTSWKVSTKRGTQSGIGASVSGLGAWAKVSGAMTFKLRHLDSSKTYDSLKKSYNIGGGVSAFWSWIGISANASTHREEIHSVFKEMANSEEVQGVASISLEVTGMYPNVQVDASAYVLILQIEDSSGNTYSLVSTGDPKSDTGAQDSNGNDVTTRNNQSTVTI